jgi:hypothetical protein
MAQGDSEGRSYRWPFHPANFWCGLLAGVGVGGLVGWRCQSGNRGAAEPGATPDRRGT